MATGKKRRTAKKATTKKRTSKGATGKKALRKSARARTKVGRFKVIGHQARADRSVTIMSARSVYDTLDISDATIRDVRRAIR